jgi:dienelactone hydrolase
VATPIVTHHELAGALGPILVDVRTTARDAAQPAILVLHGFKGFKDYAFLPVISERLARAGYTAVTFSVSGAGVDAEGAFTHPDRFARNTYSREMDDIARVVRALSSGALDLRPPTALGMIGHSRGGGVALCVARETPAIAALVVWAPIATVRRYSDAAVELWRRHGRMEVENSRTGQRLPMDYEIVEDVYAHEARFDIRAAAAALERPWLLVQGTGDETVPHAEGQELAALATAPGFEALFIEGTGHTFGARHPWSGPTAETEALFGATTRFLAHHLR